MTSKVHWREELRRRQALTVLNLFTSERYDRCEANGGHLPNGQTVMRDVDGRLFELKVCSRCGCPYGGPRQRWTGSKQGGRHD